MKIDPEMCNLCGICNSASEPYLVTKNHKFSPRFAMFLLRKEQLDLILFNHINNPCMKRICPNGIDLDFIELREFLVDNEVTHPKIEEMLNKIKKYGTPYGDLESGEDPDDLCGG